jgi:hypothetical protein
MMCLVHTAGGAPLFFGPRAVEKLRNRKTKVTSYNLDLNLIGDYWGWFGSRSYHHTGMVSMWCVSCSAHCAVQTVTTEHLCSCMCALVGLATVFLSHGMPAGACESGMRDVLHLFSVLLRHGLPVGRLQACVEISGRRGYQMRPTCFCGCRYAIREELALVGRRAWSLYGSGIRVCMRPLSGSGGDGIRGDVRPLKCLLLQVRHERGAGVGGRGGPGAHVGEASAPA